jgi:hypothetical protein
MHIQYIHAFFPKCTIIMYKTNIAHMQVKKATILDSKNEMKISHLRFSGLKSNKVHHENN